MADAPRWDHQLSSAARFVAAHGLPTRVTPPARPLDERAWSELVSECDAHRLTGLLVAAVAADALPVTTEQRAQAARLEADLTRQRIVYERRFAPILGVLDRADIDVRVLKGTAVAALDFPDAQMRPTGDLDLLVRPEQIARASDVLVAAGGMRIDPDPTPGWCGLVGRGATVAIGEMNLEVDLHRILVWGPLGVRVPDRELWDTDRAYTFAEAERRTLGREETLLHACSHLLVLGVVRARELRDVAQIAAAPALDADRLLALARRWGQESILATAVVFAHRELGLAPDADPLGAWAATYRVPALDRLWLRTDSTVDAVHGLEQLGVFWELRHVDRPWASRAMLLRANFAPLPGTYERPAERLRRLGRRLAPGAQP
ncbi:MAG: nucleotidyltransferase family protein [Actinobacteria bacterium]|nr:nucleotidyltransferase family protein [Actinomycetota bacterium]